MRIAIVDDLAAERALLKDQLEQQLHRRNVQADILEYESGETLAGVARMVVAFGDQLRDETFKERVGFMSVRQLSRIAKERGAGSLCYAEAMLVAYNRKCKYTLRMTKLHSGKVAAEDDFVEENEEPLADDPVLEE